MLTFAVVIIGLILLLSGGSAATRKIDAAYPPTSAGNMATGGGLGCLVAVAVGVGGLLLLALSQVGEW